MLYEVHEGIGKPSWGRKVSCQFKRNDFVDLETIMMCSPGLLPVAGVLHEKCITKSEGLFTAYSCRASFAVDIISLHKMKMGIIHFSSKRLFLRHG